MASADENVYLYVESDGMVFLVERDGLLAFPREGEWKEEDEVELEYRGEMHFPEGKVLFAVPHLHAWPRDWTFKDDVSGMSNVHPLVRRAINASLVREVVGALVLHPDSPDAAAPDARILLVKASRGFTKGMWNIPGGFVTYGEHPEEGMVRELLEETGIHVKLDKLLGVFTQKFQSPYFLRGHMYVGRAEGTQLTLQMDEIAEAEWFTISDVKRLVLNPFARRALEALEKGRGLELD